MVEKVDDRKLFHVTLTKPYKKAFVYGQTAMIGEANNPFFSFYESAREYPVNHNGQLINVRAVDWLKRVRDKTVVTTPETLANYAVEVAVHYVMLCRELIMEEIRRDDFNGAPPSRQRCLYACDTLDEARYWNQRIGENGTICELKCRGTIHRADARLLLGDSEPLSITRERGRMYWRGEAGDNPEFETLFVGEAIVTRFGL
jgi:hypothetical protein